MRTKTIGISLVLLAMVRFFPISSCMAQDFELEGGQWTSRSLGYLPEGSRITWDIYVSAERPEGDGADILITTEYELAKTGEMGFNRAYYYESYHIWSDTWSYTVPHADEWAIMICNPNEVLIYVWCTTDVILPPTQTTPAVTVKETVYVTQCHDDLEGGYIHTTSLDYLTEGTRIEWSISISTAGVGGELVITTEYESSKGFDVMRRYYQLSNVVESNGQYIVPHSDEWTMEIYNPNLTPICLLRHDVNTIAPPTQTTPAVTVKETVYVNEMGVVIFPVIVGMMIVILWSKRRS